MQEIQVLRTEAWAQYYRLGQAAEAEKAAGIPALAGTSQAFRAAALDCIMQTSDESCAIIKRKSVCSWHVACAGGSLRAAVVVALLLACQWAGAVALLIGVWARLLYCIRCIWRRPQAAPDLGAWAYL